MANVKRVSEDQASSEGFSQEQIVASRSHPDGYLGDRGGFMYFNTQVELRMGEFEQTGMSGAAQIPEQQGDR